MTVLVGYIPTPEGEAAVERAVVEAWLRDVPPVVLNVHRDDIPADGRRMYEEQAA